MTSPRHFVLFWLALMVSVANVSAQSTSTRRVEASAQTHDFSSLGWADSFQHLQQTMSREHASSSRCYESLSYFEFGMCFSVKGLP
jgi:hypothetical protein